MSLLDGLLGLDAAEDDRHQGEDQEADGEEVREVEEHPTGEGSAAACQYSTRR